MFSNRSDSAKKRAGTEPQPRSSRSSFAASPVRLTASAPHTSREIEAASRGRAVPLTASPLQYSIQGTARTTGQHDVRMHIQNEARRGSADRLQAQNSAASSQPSSSTSSRLNPRLPPGHRDDSRNKSMLADWASRPRTNEMTALGIPARRRDAAGFARDIEDRFGSGGRR